MRKNGLGGHYWYYQPGRHEMVIIFHDANKAGPHIDVHIGRLSVIRRVKPEIYEQLRYNGEGQLTQDSCKILINFLKDEIDNKSRIPQNLDHSARNAKASWTGGSRSDNYYGAGLTRQVLSVSRVDIIKAHADGPIEMYAPMLNSHRPMYMYKLYHGEETGRSPILIWGNMNNHAPKFEERLHLNLVHPEEFDIVQRKGDLQTSTAKYDGSSCYFVIDKKGTTVFSPRTSKKTDEQIEYTFKLDGLANVTSDTKVTGMGELMFKEKTIFGTKYLPQAKASGLLNSNNVLPKNVVPEIRIYRVDKIGHENISNLNFFSNRELQENVAKLDKKLQVVELMDIDTAKHKGFEGVVVVPENTSVNDGMKVKFWQDANDWRIDEVNFFVGPKGSIAGIVECTSLKSGKKFNMGPGQIGNQTLTKYMMNAPDEYIGSVIRVRSREGHEGRAAKMLDFHMDKGYDVKQYDLDSKNPYYYKDEHDNDVFRVRRFKGRFIQEHPTSSGWHPGRNGTPNVLYRLPELLQRKNEPVYIVEGEKDVNRLREEGLLATTNPGGAGKWQNYYSKEFKDRDVIILPDNDSVGQRHANEVAHSVSSYARSVKIVDLPGTSNKEDIYNWLESGNTTDDLQELIENSSKYEPQLTNG